MRTTSPGPAAPYRYERPRWRRPLILVTVIAVLLGIGGYMAYSAYERFVQKLLTVPGCQAGTGANAVALDFGQAADAATIAGVAVRNRLPRYALTIAYATALQEAKLENPDYGDRDSVGVFQQRPSEGWGKAADLENPAYAANAFFAALVKVPRYTTLPVDVAAQDVQRSADGSAYEQYAQTGAVLAADFTARPHAVTCWYDPATQAASEGISSRLNLRGALRGMARTFGEPGGDRVVQRVSLGRSSGFAVITAAAGSGWTVANWLVTNASSYGITRVSYRGYQWTAGLSETSWQSEPGTARAGIVAS